MLHRARNHPHQTEGMREAMEVFQEWVQRYKQNKQQQSKISRTASRDEHNRSVASTANQHSLRNIGDEQQFLQQAADDRRGGKAALREAARLAHGGDGQARVAMPFTAFVSIFGAVGGQGYGRHDTVGGHHTVTVEGNHQVVGLWGKQASKKKGAEVSSMKIEYAEQEEFGHFRFQYGGCKQWSGLGNSNRGALVDQYLEMTKQTLPSLAAAHKWVLRLDHCFQRVVLDAMCECCWYSKFDQKKGAIHQMTEAQLEKALELCGQIAADVSGNTLRRLNQQSLALRGKLKTNSKLDHKTKTGTVLVG